MCACTVLGPRASAGGRSGAPLWGTFWAHTPVTLCQVERNNCRPPRLQRTKGWLGQCSAVPYVDKSTSVGVLALAQRAPDSEAAYLFKPAQLVAVSKRLLRSLCWQHIS